MIAVVINLLLLEKKIALFNRNSGKNEMASLFVKTLLNSSLGIGTSCMNDWVMDYFQ